MKSYFEFEYDFNYGNDNKATFIDICHGSHQRNNNNNENILRLQNKTKQNKAKQNNNIL